LLGLPQAKQALESSAERHSGALLGGYKELESQDMDAREAAEFATEQLSAQANSSHPWQLNKVLGNGGGEDAGRAGGGGEITGGLSNVCVVELRLEGRVEESEKLGSWASHIICNRSKRGGMVLGGGVGYPGGGEGTGIVGDFHCGTWANGCECINFTAERVRN